MQGKTRSHKPDLIVGLGKITRRKRLLKNSEIVEEVKFRIKGCMNVETYKPKIVTYILSYGYTSF